MIRNPNSASTFEKLTILLIRFFFKKKKLSEIFEEL